MSENHARAQLREAFASAASAADRVSKDEQDREALTDFHNAMLTISRAAYDLREYATYDCLYEAAEAFDLHASLAWARRNSPLGG